MKTAVNEEGELVDLARNLSTAPEGESRSELSAVAKAAVFRAWADSHRHELLLLSDTVSRQNIYSEERL